MRRKPGRRTLASLFVLALAGCALPKDPITMPAPGDNVLRVEIHVYQVTGSGDIQELRRDVKARVTASNGHGDPLLGDDHQPISNWRHDTTEHDTWKLELSQPPDAPTRGIGVSIRARVALAPDDSHVNVVCSFFVNGVEDLKNAQAGVGPEIVCMYRTGF